MDELLPTPMDYLGTQASSFVQSVMSHIGVDFLFCPLFFSLNLSLYFCRMGWDHCCACSRSSYLCCIVLYCIVSYHVMTCCVVPYRLVSSRLVPVSRRVVLYCVVLCRIVLCHIGAEALFPYFFSPAFSLNTFSIFGIGWDKMKQNHLFPNHPTAVVSCHIKRVVWCRLCCVVLYCIVPYRIMSCHIVFCHIVSYPAILYCIMLCRVVLCHVVLSYVVSYRCPLSLFLSFSFCLSLSL